MEPLQLAVALMAMNSEPQWQEVCVSNEGVRSCVQYESRYNVEYSKTMSETGTKHYISTPDRYWTIDCKGDDVIYGGGYCIVDRLRLRVEFGGYGFSMEDITECSGFGCY